MTEQHTKRISRHEVERWWFDATGIYLDNDVANNFITHLLMSGKPTNTPSELVKMLCFWQVAFKSIVRSVGEHYGEKREPVEVTRDDLVKLETFETLLDVLREPLHQLTTMDSLKDEESWECYADLREAFGEVETKLETLYSRLTSTVPYEVLKDR